MLRDNVAGFSLDLAALSAQDRSVLVEAVAHLPPTQPLSPERIALRVEGDDMRVDLGVTVGAFLAALGYAQPAPQPKRSTPLDVVLAYLGSSEDQRPARRFTARLLRDVQADPNLAPAVKAHADAIAPLFDPFFYAEKAGEDALANPLLHYVLAGWREGYSPSPLFCPAYYRRLRGAISGDPALDFLTHNAPCDPHPLFDTAFYGQSLLHYLEEEELRSPSPLFDARAFQAAFPQSERTPLEHFLLNRECWDFPVGRAFDAKLYAYQIEVERGERLDSPPYVHYITQGYQDETLLPNLLFDPVFYREHNQLSFHEPALLHYLREGEAAGLSCHPFFSPRLATLEHVLAHPGEIRTDPRMEGPIDKRLFDFVQALLLERGGFDADIYRDANPDIAEEEDLLTHWQNVGRQQGRIASRAQILQQAGLCVRDLPLGFVLEDYVSLHEDLAYLRGRFASALLHWGRHGRHERRLIGRWTFRLFDLALDLPSASAPLNVLPTKKAEICILIHIFYPDLLPELAHFARNFRDFTFDIVINIVDEVWTPQFQHDLRTLLPGACVILSNDCGRDIGGLTRMLSLVDLSRYDLIAFFHSKKSPHIHHSRATYWRRSLLNAIAGTPERARENVELFRTHPEIGMLGAEEWRSHDMGANCTQYEHLLDLFGVRGPARELDYLSGFMFLLRAEIAQSLYNVLKSLSFEYGGDKPLEFHKDGQIAHGVERALPALVRHMGYTIHYGI